MKLYGSLTNRLEEGRNFTGRELREGDDITMYYYSDCTCYFITKLISQKEIQVQKYHVCADFSKEGGMGHQNWLYFKTRKEHNTYLNSVHTDHKWEENPIEDTPDTWVLRYGTWQEKINYTYNSFKTIAERSGFKFEPYFQHFFTEKEREKLLNGGTVAKYNKLPGKVSFGVRNYYYDWSF